SPLVVRCSCSVASPQRQQGRLARAAGSGTRQTSGNGPLASPGRPCGGLPVHGLPERRGTDLEEGAARLSDGKFQSRGCTLPLPSRRQNLPQPLGSQGLAE